MKSNFSFLESDYPYLAELGETAEQLVYYDVDFSNTKMRILAEKITEIILKIENLDDYLNYRQIDRLDILERKGIIPDSIQSIFHVLRKMGNKSAHEYRKSSTKLGMQIIQLGFYLACWFMEVYVSYDFKKPKFHQPDDINQVKENRIKELELQLEEQKKLYAQTFQNIESDEANQEKRKIISFEYAKNHPFTEAETRVIIDRQLNDAGFETDTSNLNYKLHHLLSAL